MPKPSKLQLLSIGAASVLAAYVALAASMQTNQTPRSLDLPPLLTADAAAVDYFLKVDGIDGESTHEGYPGFIEIDSFSWGLTNLGAASSGGAVTGKPSIQDFHFAAQISKASPKLFEACATGQHFPSALLVAVRTGGEEQQFLNITLSDAFISSYQTGGSQGGDIVPTDTFSINFSEIEYEYTPQNPDGTLGTPVSASYSVKESKKT